jgi:D-alanine-D-alanine ligase
MDELNTKYQQPVLLEQYIVGREFYVGVLGNDKAELLPIVELDFSGDAGGAYRIASFDVKWAEPGEAAAAATESVIAQDLPTEWIERMQHAALDAFQSLRLRDYARVDMRVTDQGDIYILEVNPNCYLEKKSEFAMAAAAGGLEYDALIGRIVELASARYAR